MGNLGDDCAVLMCLSPNPGIAAAIAREDTPPNPVAGRGACPVDLAPQPTRKEGAAMYTVTALVPLRDGQSS
ncbi:hypothetical protein JOD54_005131 [Actinokineospora baliensis]|nr:hypothetical protein [Actinokineospora baliensis]